MQVTRRCRYGSTALHAACLMENTDIVSLLVKLGADVNAVDSAGVERPFAFLIPFTRMRTFRQTTA